MADPAVSRPEEAPQHRHGGTPLAAMYALVFGVVACVAVSAGELLYLGEPAFSASGTGKIDACAARFPLSDPPPFYRCVAGVFRDEGLFVLVVVGLVLSMAVALTAAGPWLSWWRFVKGRPETPGEVTRARFEMLCDRSGASGRWRPVLSGPLLGRSQAFTIAMPGVLRRQGQVPGRLRVGARAGAGGWSGSFLKSRGRKCPLRSWPSICSRLRPVSSG
ncbi:MAG: hypothetical protein JO242_01865, partial [Streptosporangiaceae bacterium]|nr:hypothetical protein [Streptosporangiaceae bacterium]